jgi:amino acid transporter
MNNKFVPEIGVTLALIFILILLVNPFDFWMPTSVHMIMLSALVLTVGFFASFVWKEKTHDEREELHKRLAGRIAFLVGIGILVVGIIVQSFAHNLDIWLPFTLGGMVLAKIFSLMYFQSRG